MLILIKAGGKERPFNFGWRSINELQTEGMPDPTQGLLSAAFKGFKYGAVIQKEPVDFTQEDVINWIDQDQKMFKKISRMITAELTEFSRPEEDQEPGK
jgi:hypothetical protein